MKYDFGITSRATPVQMSMLMLAGLIAACDNPSDKDYEKFIVEGQERLVRRCGRDFGFDIVKWHEFLLSDPDSRDSYCLPLFETIHSAVLSMHTDPRRTAIVRSLAG